MTNVNQAPLPRLSKAPLVRASLVKRRYIKYLALPFFSRLLRHPARKRIGPILTKTTASGARSGPWQYRYVYIIIIVKSLSANSPRLQIQ